MQQKLLSFFVVFSLFFGIAQAQNKSVRGKVTDEFNNGLAGVSVIVQGKNQTTQTDMYGDYQIQSEQGSTLIFRFIGYTDQEVSVGTGNVYNITLTQSSRDLDEVVVTAYGSQTRESIVGSVASINAEEIAKRPVSSATAALEGIAPGIQVNNSYGEPGRGPNIRIRGFGSINGNSDPVYILDGVVFQGNISDINPSDIESISVLKDATSGALYGNRAANGAIVITTKRGRGATTINVTANQGLFTRGIKEYETLGPKQYMETAWKGYRNQLLNSNPSWTTQQANDEASATLVPSILRLNIFDKPNEQLFNSEGALNPDVNILGDYAGDLNWFDPISRNGRRQEYLLSGSGSGEKGNYLFSMGYLDEEGYIKTSEFTRLSGRLSAQVTPTTWLKAGMSANAAHQLSNFTTGDGSSMSNPWNSARSMAPIYPVHLHDPSTGAFLLDDLGNRIYDDGTTTRNQMGGRHIVWEMELNDRQRRRNTINSQAFMDFNILRNLKLSVLGDINLRYDEERSYENALIGDGSGNFGRGGRDTYNYKTYTLQQQLNYSESINGIHNIDVLVGHENYGQTHTRLYARKAGETFAGMPELINYTNITTLWDYTRDDKTESYLGRLRYNYDEKYFADASIRRDGTSRLHPDKRWGTFWSLGGTWIASKEEFMQDINWLDDLKVRAATGVVGNVSSLNLYAYMPLFEIGQNNNLPAFWKENNANFDLIWEGSQSSSVALEGRIANRVNFIAEYFDRRSKDLLFDVNLPLSAGSTTSARGEATISQNIGDIVNRGFEITVDVDVIRKQDFKWNLGLNATFLRNKIINLPEQNREDGIISAPFKYMEGYSVFDYFLPTYVGVDMLTGQGLYKADVERYDPTATDEPWEEFQEEINGTVYTRNSAYALREFQGTGVPKMMGAINTAIDYKNFRLSGIFTYSIGGKALDYSYMDMMRVTSNPGSVHKDVLNSWTEAPEGMTADSDNRISKAFNPQVNYQTSQYNNANSSRFLFDNTYFAIKNIALGYRLPSTVADQLRLRSLAVNFAVENLATFTKLQGYSPQQTFGGYSQNQFVPARTFSLGINLGI